MLRNVCRIRVSDAWARTRESSICSGPSCRLRVGLARLHPTAQRLLDQTQIPGHGADALAAVEHALHRTYLETRACVPASVFSTSFLLPVS